jgi:hypothetical protein
MLKGITFRREGNKLIAEIDLDKTYGLSSSLKTEIVATTGGNVDVPDEEDSGMKIGINVYKPRGK